MLSSLVSGTSRNCGHLLHSSRSINHATLERYGTIRNFFKKQHFVASQARIQPYRMLSTHSAPRRWSIRTAPSASESLLRTRPNFHPTTLALARAFATASEPPEKSPQHSGQSNKKIEDSKSHPPEVEEDIVGAEHRFPHARDHENYSRFFQRLAMSLPHPHRPTREDFLNIATGFWQRLRIRFKWFTVRSFRKFNADDISAFVTWFLMSHALWILIGT